MSRVSGHLVTKCIWTDQIRVPLETGAWSPDPTTPLNVDPKGVTIINEATVGRNCVLPSDVAVAVMINQNQDRRAPARSWGTRRTVRSKPGSWICWATPPVR